MKWMLNRMRGGGGGGGGGVICRFEISPTTWACKEADERIWWNDYLFPQGWLGGIKNIPREFKVVCIGWESWCCRELGRASVSCDWKCWWLVGWNEVWDGMDLLIGNETLDVRAIMTHASVPPDQRKALGIDDSLVRLSIGIEDVDDIVADLTNALNEVSSKKWLCHYVHGSLNVNEYEYEHEHEFVSVWVCMFVFALEASSIETITPLFVFIFIFIFVFVFYFCFVFSFLLLNWGLPSNMWMDHSSSIQFHPSCFSATHCSKQRTHTHTIHTIHTHNTVLHTTTQYNNTQPQLIAWCLVWQRSRLEGEEVVEMMRWMKISNYWIIESIYGINKIFQV